MMLKAYSFFDMKVGIYSTPFFTLHEGQALRIAKEVVTDVNTSVGRHPADFALHLVGEFDDNTGVLSGVGPAVVVTCASLVPYAPSQLHLEEKI